MKRWVIFFYPQETRYREIMRQKSNEKKRDKEVKDKGKKEKSNWQTLYNPLHHLMNRFASIFYLPLFCFPPLFLSCLFSIFLSVFCFSPLFCHPPSCITQCHNHQSLFSPATNRPISTMTIMTTITNCNQLLSVTNDKYWTEKRPDSTVTNKRDDEQW